MNTTETIHGGGSPTSALHLISTVASTKRTFFAVDGSNISQALRTYGLAIDLFGLERFAGRYGPGDIAWFQGDHAHAAPFFALMEAETTIQPHRVSVSHPAPGQVKADADSTLIVETMAALFTGEYDTLVLLTATRKWFRWCSTPSPSAST